MKVKAVILAVILTGTLACEAMHRTSFVVSTEHHASTASEDTIISTLRELFASNGLTLFSAEASNWPEWWRWRDPKERPGLSVRIRRQPNEIVVLLEQDPFGLAKRSPKYNSVRESLIKELIARFGKDCVTVDEGAAAQLPR